MGICIWIVDPNNCIYSYYLHILIYIGLVISIILLILYICTFIFRIKNMGLKVI